MEQATEKLTQVLQDNKLLGLANDEAITAVAVEAKQISNKVSAALG